MTKRAAICAGYSSDLQQATSIDDQIAMARRLCGTQNWQVVHIFRDKEITGRHTGRPGFQDMKAAINRREVDVVVVEAIDRLSCPIRDLPEHFELPGFQRRPSAFRHRRTAGFLQAARRGHGGAAL